MYSSSFFFYRHGRQIAAYVRESVERFAGPRARHILTVVGENNGLIGTALAQALLASIGFWIAGVSQALTRFPDVCLATNVPRIGRIVVARGRDAADIPLINSFGPHTLKAFRVWTYEVPDSRERMC